MATKRSATARHKDETPEEQRQGMPKTEAYKVLQVAPNAEEALVTKAYWHLATSVRMLAAHDPEAREKLDQLNRAYLVLNPAQTEAPLSKEVQPAAAEETSFLDDFVAWARRVVEQTVARWPGRAPELGILTGTTVWLGYLGLSAGANGAWVILALAVALVTIWSPWRRDGRA